MKSINGINWKENNIPERLILKNKQKYNISYLYIRMHVRTSIYKIETTGTFILFESNICTYVSMCDRMLSKTVQTV